MIHMRPLPSSFLLFSMLGLAISGVYTFSGRLDSTWGFTFMLVCGIMFVASIMSMTPTFKPHKETEVKKAKRKLSKRS